MTAISSFITSLATSFVVFVILVLLFLILSRRPGNAHIYYPLRALRGELPFSKRRGVFTWAIEAFKVSEKELVERAGLDATVYIHLHTAALKIILLSAIYCLPILIPLAVTDNYNAVKASDPNASYTYSALDNLGMSNVTPGSMRIWAFLLGLFWVSFVVYYVLWKSYRRVLDLRDIIVTNSRARPQQYTVFVRDIPKLDEHETRTDQVSTFFRKVHPGYYGGCFIVNNLRLAKKLFEDRQEARRKLEHAEKVFELSRKKGGDDGVRPTHKTGFCGLVGTKEDSITYWAQKKQELTLALAEEQERVQQTPGQEPASLVFFNDRRAASEAAQVVHAPIALQWQVFPAPEPRECVWSNMHIPMLERSIRQAISNVLTFIIVVFYMIPIALVASITTLDNLAKLLPFIKSLTKNGVSNTIIGAYLPQIALLIFLKLLPPLLLFLSKAEGIPAQSQIVLSAMAKYFYFIIFNVFLGVTLFGTAFSGIFSIKNLIKNSSLSVNGVVQLLGSKIPPLATYYITYVALKFFIGYGLELSRLIPLIIFHVKRKFFIKTERELFDAWQPGAFKYHTKIPSDLLIVTLALCYATFAPMILFFSFLYFFIGWLVKRNQALNVHVPDWESFGSMWPHIHNRVLCALVVAQITGLGYFSIKKFPYTPILIILLILSWIFYVVCKRTYHPSFAVVSLYVASEVSKEMPTMTSITEAYTPIYLLPIEIGDEMFDENYVSHPPNYSGIVTA